MCGLTVTGRRASLKLETCRDIWFARTLFAPYSKEELPYLDEYVRIRQMPSQERSVVDVHQTEETFRDDSEAKTNSV